jgi:hypothetical protein
MTTGVQAPHSAESKPRGFMSLIRSQTAHVSAEYKATSKSRREETFLLYRKPRNIYTEDRLQQLLNLSGTADPLPKVTWTEKA